MDQWAGVSTRMMSNSQESNIPSLPALKAALGFGVGIVSGWQRSSKSLSTYPPFLLISGSVFLANCSQSSTNKQTPDSCRFGRGGWWWQPEGSPGRTGIRRHLVSPVMAARGVRGSYLLRLHAKVLPGFGSLNAARSSSAHCCQISPPN